MPDVHVARHGDRWAVKDAPDATPIFESATREEAESEARRRAAGGTVHVSTEPDQESVGGQAAGERPPGASEAAEAGSPERPSEDLREPQAGL